MATTRTSLLTVIAVSLAASAASAQSQPAAVPVPIVTAAMGIGNVSTTVCSAGIAATDGSLNGDGCPATQAKLAAPQGAAIDKYGNIYIADYNDKQVRVVYNGNPALAAAITAANSGYAISPSRSAPAPTPVVGNVYTLAGIGSAGVAAFTVSGNPCANYATTGQPTGLNTLGDGCPAASAPIGARDVKFDADGNLFFTDYTNARIRVFCVNCATTTLAAKLITLENPTVTAPVNGAMYTVAGFASGYRDAAPGYNTASNASGATAAQNIALLRSPTGAAISSSDDVYIADNTNNAVRLLYNGGTVAKNILVAQGIAAPVQGYVYTIAGAGCVSAATNKTGSVSSANACLTTTGSDTPALGNSVGLKVSWSVYLDSNNNVFYADSGNARVKMIYGGIAAPAALSGTLQTGYTYTYAGQGTGTANTQNGVAPSSLVFADVQGVGGDPYGNLFVVDYSAGLLYEVYAQTGIAAIIGGGAGVATPVAGAYCNGLVTGPQMTDAFYNGCPATQAKFSSPRGPVVTDSLGNLYFGDAIGYFVRKFSYNPTFSATTVGATGSMQPYAFSFLTASAITSTTVTPSDFTDAGGDTCTSVLTVAIGAPGTTCVVNVTFAPKSVGARPGAVLLNGASGILGATAFTGIGNGAALALDPATLTTTGSGYAPAGIAVGPTGSVVFTDTTGKKAVRYTGATATTIATGFTAPSGIAVDNAGNVFIADSTANTLTAVPVIGAQYTITSALSAPKQVATDSLGRIYVADSGNNRIVVFGQGGTKTFTTLPFTGLTAPSSVAVDSNFNVYAADSTHIVKLTPLGVQSTIITQSGVLTLAVDAAGDLYTVNTTTLAVFTPAGVKTSPFNSLSNATAVAIDPTGNLYVADPGNAGFDTLARTSGYYKFTGTSGTTSIHLTSIGNISVSTTAFTATDTTDYTITPATTNGCSGALASGTFCLYNAAYVPLAPGILTDNLTFTAPVSNGTPTFELINISLIPAITLKASAANLTYGQTETLTATVYGTGNNNGTVNFYNGTTLIASKAVDTNGLATYSYQPAVGTYSVTATYTPTGSSTPTVTSTPAVPYTVTQTAPTLTLTALPSTGYASTTFTFMATLASTAGTPTGSVNFYLGGSSLGTATLTNGVATLTSSSLPVGTDCITASYAGDTNFSALPPSACSNVAVAAGFSVTPSSSALAFQVNYQEAQTILNITTGGRTDTLYFACTGLPAKLACNFSPSTVTLAGDSSTVQVQMLVANSSATYGALYTTSKIAFAFLPFAALLLFGLRRKRMILSVFLFLAIGISLTGCSGQDPTTLNQPSGTYHFSVNVNSGTTTLTTIPFTLTIP